MASGVDAIPEELMHPWSKDQVIAWLRASKLPSRFRRRLLQEWGDKQSVPVTPEDYTAVVRR
jgi:hypothetical protein